MQLLEASRRLHSRGGYRGDAKKMQLLEASRPLHGRGGNRDDAKLIYNSLKLLGNFTAVVITGVMQK